MIDDVWEIQGKGHGIMFEKFLAGMESMKHRKKLTTIKELCSAAVFVTSDKGSAVSGTRLNLIAGMIVP